MTSTIPTTVDELLDYWPGNIPFKKSLVSDDGCMCAQGQALHFLGGYSPDELRKLPQWEADEKVAKIFGISIGHSALLRIINDHQEGAPIAVIRNPEQILGDQAPVVLALWRHLDKMSSAAKAAAKAAAGEAAWEAAGRAAGAAAGAAAGRAAWATNEVQGAAIMRANNQPFYFLPLFGFATPEAVIEAEAGK